MLNNRPHPGIIFGFFLLAFTAAIPGYAGKKNRPSVPPITPPTASDSLRTVAIFETSVYEIEMNPKCDLISLRRVDAGALKPLI